MLLFGAPWSPWLFLLTIINSRVPRRPRWDVPARKLQRQRRYSLLRGKAMHGLNLRSLIRHAGVPRGEDASPGVGRQIASVNFGPGHCTNRVSILNAFVRIRMPCQNCSIQRLGAQTVQDMVSRRRPIVAIVALNLTLAAHYHTRVMLRCNFRQDSLLSRGFSKWKSRSVSEPQ